MLNGIQISVIMRDKNDNNYSITIVVVHCILATVIIDCFTG